MKIKYLGKYGLHPVYETKKGIFAIATYGNITEIHPVKQIDGFNKKSGFGFLHRRGKIKQIKRTGSRRFEINYAKKLIS